MKTKSLFSFLGSVLTAYILLIIGYVAGAVLLSKSGLPQPSFPPNRVSHPLADNLAGLTIVLGVAGAAWILRGSFIVRWLLLTVYTYVMSAWEASYFTKFGGTGFLLVLGILPSLFCSAVIAWRGRSSEPSRPFREAASEYFQSRPVNSWAWRFGAAWLSFPLIYLIFGSLVGPIVVPYYQSLDFLTLPPMGLIIQVQLIRSLFILAVITRKPSKFP